MSEDWLRSVLYLSGMSYDALEDGVQEVRARLLAQPTGAVRDVRAWAGTVATNIAMDWHRGRRRQQDLVERLASDAAIADSAHVDADDQALALSVAAGLARLPIQQRRLLVLRFYLDLSIGEIAREIGVPEGTVKSRLHTALQAMRVELRKTEVI